MRQSRLNDNNKSRMASKKSEVAQPSYPLLRMTLVVMANLTAAVTTHKLIPTLVMEEQQKQQTEGNGDSNNTLPSLSITLVSLFVFQSFIGLIQAYIHNSSLVSTSSSSSKKNKTQNSSSTSLVGVWSFSIFVGIIGFIICHTFSVLFGAGLVEQAKETSQLACYLSLLTFYPASFVLGSDLESWIRVFVHNSPQSYTEAAFYCQGMMTIFGAWLGSIVIPLDWDRPWQAWPVPCILGAFLFYCIGTVVGLVANILMQHGAARKEFGLDTDESDVKKAKTN
ncbi:hypothetical protein BGZ76_000993 [Entomortierella beljakovae]|nr:hypothetical protein BGZ76_000993 [Entomortierella beljakovae]